MSKDIIPFARIWSCIEEIFASPDVWPEDAEKLYVIRDLYGRVRLALSETVENDLKYHSLTKPIADRLRETLGPHTYPSEDSVLYVPLYLMDEPETAIRKVGSYLNVFFVERLVIGDSWWTVAKDNLWVKQAERYVLYSVKGGVGRSTTVAVLARHLAHAGERVMVVDLDLESPGVSSSMLSVDAQPEFGIVDWMVEDLVGQGDGVIDKMTATPSWSQDFPGEVYIVPVHGREPGEFFAKLGRTYLHAVDKKSGKGIAWASRLRQMLSRLEERHKPTVVLLESCSGLNDIAASVVTDFDAHVLLFAVDSDSTWQNYQILFRHWRDVGRAVDIRERLSLVSALIPETHTASYETTFQQHGWDLFQEFLYDTEDSSKNSDGEFNFLLYEENPLAPHVPMPIYWTRGLSSGVSLRNIERHLVPISNVYSEFLNRFDILRQSGDEGYSK